MADPAAVVVVENARFTVLTPALVRMEWSPDGRFEDRASFAFVNRHLPVPRFGQKEEGGWYVIDTGELVVNYRLGGGRFSPDNLRIEYTAGSKPAVWTPGMENQGNLMGTTRTLDGVSGACPLETGLLSRDGWSLIDDSHRLLFGDGPQRWATPRPDPDALDWYFFGHGHDYARQLSDFTKVAGQIPLPPRYVFGAWWSRYWAYSADELKQLVDEFDAHDVPLDVLVVDMDWHLDGWTGYTWNKALFPDPQAFLNWAHERGLKTTLNLHPHDGVRNHEAAFPEFARAMGKDPEKIDHIPFNCADPRYMQAYFDVLHHPLEKAGVDFWWLDWQQGAVTEIPGLDPLFWLNHLHWRDMQTNAQRGDKRPLIFSRWGGLGNHRYQIGFSGDTFCNWPSLAFQPYFTATAGNVGFAYWSHDIGGHQPGKVDPELYTRWVQFGALSPVLRTHTTKNPAAERRIWEFPKPYFEAMREAFRLRYALIPYIYSAARQCYDTGLPLCRPLYYAWPEIAEAYTHGGEYLFGDDLLVAPVIEPASAFSRCSEVSVWIPPGEWVNWFTDEVFSGPATVLLQVPLNEIPLFARAGAVIPATEVQRRSSGSGPLVLHAFTGETGKTVLYEDDGLSDGYATGNFARTRIERTTDGTHCKIALAAAEGPYAEHLPARDVELRLHGFFPDQPSAAVHCNGAAVPQRTGDAQTGWWFDTEQVQFVIRVPQVDPKTATEFSINTGYAGGTGVPVRRGFRGRVQAVRDVEAMLGISPPEDAPGSAAVRLEMQQCRSLDRAAVASALAWNMTLKRVREAQLSDADRSRAMLRLLGVVPRVRLTPSADGTSATLHVELGLQRADALLGVPNWSAQVRLAPPHHLQVPAAEALQLGPVAVIRGLSKDIVLGGGLGQTDVLRGALAVQLDRNQLEVPIDMVVLPSINRWWLVGPFDAPEATRLATKFGPEEKLDLQAEYAGKGEAPIRWQRAERVIEPGSDLSDEFFVEFHKYFGQLHYDAVAYGLTYLESPRDLDAELVFGSDDGIVIWLDGKEVHRHDIGRAYTPKQDRVPVKLHAGVNALMVKISQGGGMWGFGMHVETPDGKPIPEIRVLLDPPAPPAE